MKVYAESLRKRTTENLRCYHCSAPATAVAVYDGLEVGLCDQHSDSAPELSLDTTCSSRGCRTFVEKAVACQDCSKIYRKCEGHGGPAAAARSLKSHRGLYHTKVQR